MTVKKNVLLLLLLLISTSFLQAQQSIKTNILVVGGGASGSAAAIQAAGMGVNTLVVEETAWLGGMLTSAGVSAIDGDHKMPSGIWGEFRQQLYSYYGGPNAVATGWVSNTLFEPHVGNAVLQKMVAAENKVQVWFNTKWKSVRKTASGWDVIVERNKKQQTIATDILVDATELGDVMAAAGVHYTIGMDSKYDTGEEQAPEKANNIVQDLTYVAVLKDFGKNADKTIRKPEGYDPAEFSCSCDVSDPASFDSPDNNCHKMMQYGRLPNNKYMINWPKCGNDYYLNIIEKTPGQREDALREAKLHTLRFVYYLQTVLGYKNLGLADDEFPTADKLPMIPYHRESRRMDGLVRLSLPYVATPYDNAQPLYRTGIAVGDYPIDHHHEKNKDGRLIDFVKIRVPSYNVPMGSLIPKGIDGLIVAEKSISVTNIVNGATRLQPVVLQIGQAAGAMAALCVQQHVQPKELDVRQVQQQLLKANGYVMPFVDVNPADPQFEIIQKIGATGILRGAGVPYQWANQTWFYPEQPVSGYELVKGLRPYYTSLKNYWAASGEMLTAEALAVILKAIGISVSASQLQNDIKEAGITNSDKYLSRRAIAVLLDKYAHPFERKISITGELQ
ncbi:FAD-dependent oxidoreductase [Danxiaibacter flavus]|uniref:FAD-dependent oxidoreductase n=1 Tax=Danxiaibacter flavus TaxID=3049108 RepID=A0ABV3ZDF5_9BACT